MTQLNLYKVSWGEYFEDLNAYSNYTYIALAPLSAEEAINSKYPEAVIELVQTIEIIY